MGPRTERQATFEAREAALDDREAAVTVREELLTSRLESAHRILAAAAERDAVAKFVGKTGATRRLKPDQQRVLAEVALVAEANAISNRNQLAILRKMVAAKPVDLWAYQRLWFDFFASVPARAHRKGKA